MWYFAMVQDYLFERYNPIFGIYGLLTRATKRDKISRKFLPIFKLIFRLKKR